MNRLVQKPVFGYAAVALFLLAVIAAVLLQYWWLVALPVVLLFYVWNVEKPILLFYLLLASIPWSVEYQVTTTLGTDFPDEPLMLLNALSALLFIVYNHKIIRRYVSFDTIAFLLLLQLLWAALTVITSTFPLLSLKYVLAKSWYLFAFVLLPVMLLDTKTKLKTTALVLTISMMLAASVALIRHAASGFTFAAINESLGPFFRNHVNYSALLVCMLPVLYAFFNGTDIRIRKHLLWVLLIIALAALYFSYARGAWVAMVTGLAAYGLLKKKALLTAYVVTLLVTAASVFWLQQNNRYLHYAHNYRQTIFHTNFTEHLVATYELKDMSTAERFYRWIAGARMVKDRWQTGFGPNTFYNNYRSYTIPLFKTWVSANEEHSTVHNYFLLLLVEQGLPGLLLFLMLLALLFYRAQVLYHATDDRFWKTTVATVAVILVMICTVNFLSDLIETDKVGSVFYVCLAVLMVAGKKINERSDLAAHVQRIA